MKIRKVVYSAGATGFFFDDQRAIKDGAAHDGFRYLGRPVTPGFDSIRQTGESVSIMLVLENGAVGLGDAAAVQYSGAGGRDPLFTAKKYIPFLEKNMTPLLEGRDLLSFKDAAKEMDSLVFDGHRLHTAVRYGLSQALLDAVAQASCRLKTEVVCAEYGLPVIPKAIPIFGQSGDDRYAAADKMIIKEADVLPHALINNVEEKLGRNGEKLAEYLRWLANRIRSLRTRPEYSPVIHIDVYGTIGSIFNGDCAKVADYMAGLEESAGEFQLYIEGPVDMEAKAPQIEALAKIKGHLRRLGSKVKTVADEWCNTYEDIVEFTDARSCDMVQIKTPDLGSVHNIVESVLYCKKHGMESYQGGTCNETDVSSRCCVHIAIATQAERILAKPGMGFDEGFSIVKNEMNRTIELLKMKRVKS